MLRTKEEIQKEIDKCLEKNKELENSIEHFERVNFAIENCDIGAMREIAGEDDLDFAEYANKMIYYVSAISPCILIRSPEIEVIKHTVQDYAYKNA